MSNVWSFLNIHIEEAVNYWISMYYVESEEYQKRKYIPGYLEAHRKESILLCKRALANLDEVPHSMEIGEDRFDMETSLTDVVSNHTSFYTAIIEFLLIHCAKESLDCTKEELFETVLKLRKIEMHSLQGLLSGYVSKEALGK
ncbi:hypothetical protein [Listeria riparia]|uniref:Uncharacterized protein n=1 Tax=Listeria riparia FSL S10-1204 TaxID=1265816 RepID=W7D8N1_9LIST|nr:hypothetical protein [Listeria riparia]EUJ45355.1 hypothetical protein PRIP_05833 [Listeria riparia FSL S10-1204]